MRERGLILWLTGMSGSGKSTLAKSVENELRLLGKQVEILDGDEVRENLSKGLGFNKEDRDTNVCRIGYVAKLLVRNGVIVIAAVISPYEKTRKEMRFNNKDYYLEVYVKCSLEECIKRDVKGLYQRAMTGQLMEFTGVNAPYEEPLHPEVIVDTEQDTLEECTEKIVAKLREVGYV